MCSCEPVLCVGCIADMEYSHVEGQRCHCSQQATSMHSSACMEGVAAVDKSAAPCWAAADSYRCCCRRAGAVREDCAATKHMSSPTPPYDPSLLLLQDSWQQSGWWMCCRST